jgi:hypothetical protein
VDVIVAIDAGIAEKDRETLAVEGAIGALERRVLRDLRRDAVVGNAEPIFVGCVIDRGVHDDAGKNLLRIDLSPCLLGVSLCAAVDAGKVLHRHLLAADGRQRPGLVALETADAPDGEAQDEQRHQHLGDPALGTLTQLVEHEKASRGQQKAGSRCPGALEHKTLIPRSQAHPMPQHRARPAPAKEP